MNALEQAPVGGKQADLARGRDAEVPSDTPDALKSALRHLIDKQKPDGDWEGEMVWNTMLLSQYVIVMKTAGKFIDKATAAHIIRHYRVTRTPEGGWGMHGESPSYVFMTTLAYVALRLLGLSATEPLCADARAFLQRQPGGILCIPTWGKFWLAICGLYEYEGVNPFPPEMFLFPDWLPLAPSNFYCHTRYVYLGIAYLYGRRFRANLGPIVDELRSELYEKLIGKRYSEIDFSRYRHRIAKTDVLVPPSAALRVVYDLLYALETIKSPGIKSRLLGWLRQTALDYCLERILYEQRASRYQGLSPVNALLNCLALYARSPHHPDLAPSLAGIEAWRWQDEAEGIRYCGARSNTWDTAFTLQALCAAPKELHADPAVQKALQTGHQRLLSLQLQEELPTRELERRDAIRGGFCFSDGQHRWPVSDCTAEALTALLHTEEVCGSAISVPLSQKRAEEAVHFLLSRQNRDGGFGTYERRRGSILLEHINPSEMYGSCMTERSYLECTASALCALTAVRARRFDSFSTTLLQAMDLAIERGVERLTWAQLPDGSYPGFWGINFTYAIFHVVKALRAAGIPANDPRVQRAAVWLLSKQRKDGGWGEHFRSCLEERYIEHSESQVVMTSWALLALLEVTNLPPHHDLETADTPIAASLRRGVAFLRSMQQADGGFPQQAQNGVFFGAAMLDYRLYKSYFPAWALARYEQARRGPRT